MMGRKMSPEIGFFFQAEDGIRDIGVTGVQTCALPIFGVAGRGREGGGDQHVLLDGAAQGHDPARLVDGGADDRSGERRVGEEGRSRGGPDYLKKKYIYLQSRPIPTSSTSYSLSSPHSS